MSRRSIQGDRIWGVTAWARHGRHESLIEPGRIPRIASEEPLSCVDSRNRYRAAVPAHM
jgi:hypothetical protein